MLQNFSFNKPFAGHAHNHMGIKVFSVINKKITTRGYDLIVDDGKEKFKMFFAKDNEILFTKRCQIYCLFGRNLKEKTLKTFKKEMDKKRYKKLTGNIIKPKGMGKKYSEKLRIIRAYLKCGK